MGRVKRRHGVHGNEASRGEGRREAQDKKVWYGPRIEPAPREGGAVKSGTPRRIGRADSRGYKKTKRRPVAAPKVSTMYQTSWV